MARPILAIKDDGTLLNGFNIQIPSYWQATTTPGVYNCLLPSCKYRRFSHRLQQKRLLVQLHCFLKRTNNTPEECKNCALATPDTSTRQKVTMEVDNGDGTKSQITQVMRVETTPDPRLMQREQTPWLVAHQPTTSDTIISPRPDLQAIEDILPPHKPGRDRKFQIDDNGIIIYEKEDGEWEAPRDINGYERDSNNPWRFTPLWKPCTLRHIAAVRFANCGCIDVIMRCNNPTAPQFTNHVTHTICQECLQRKV